MLAASSTGGVVLLALGAILVLTAGVALYLRGRTTERGADIPPIMRPGPSDGALETPLLQKLMGWSVVLVAFFALWMPYTWLLEPSTNLHQEEELKAQAIERGQESVLLFSEDNQYGVGCVRCHGPELRGGVIASGNSYAYPPDLTTICAGVFASPAHSQIASIDDIYQVIEEGRNAMPSWSIRFKGALDDQQVNDIVNYLVSMSSENVPFENNICQNPDAVTRATEQATAAGTVLERP